MLDEQLIIATTCAKEGTDAAAMVEHPPTTAETVASNIKAAQAARAVIAARELVPDERSTRATGVSVFDAYSTNVVMSQCGRLSKGQKLRCNFDEPQHEPGCKCMGTACRHDNAIVFYCIYCGEVGPTFDQALQCEARCSGAYDVRGVEFIRRGMQDVGLDTARSMGNSFFSELVQKA